MTLMAGEILGLEELTKVTPVLLRGFRAQGTVETLIGEVPSHSKGS